MPRRHTGADGSRRVRRDNTGRPATRANLSVLDDVLDESHPRRTGARYPYPTSPVWSPSR